MLTQFPGLATSGRHNFAMITDPYRRKFMVKLTIYGMSIRSLFPGMYASHKKGTYPNIRQRPMSYNVVKRVFKSS